MDPVVLSNLRHVYPAARSSKMERVALHGISFSVGGGEIFGLLGPNGGGKTTTFRILSTAMRPTSGGAAVMGFDVVREPEKARRHLGVVFQNPSLDKKLTVEENLWHQGHLYGLAGQALTARINEVLPRVALADRRDDRIESLSGGLQRRAEIVKGLLHRPEVLLLDEPTTGLDPGARFDVWNYLQELRARERVTVVVTTHLMEEAEKCDRVAILREGVIVALGTPAALRNQIGGDVITVETEHPETLAKSIAEKFKITPQILGNQLRIERDCGHEFIPQLVGAFPGDIRSVTLGKPTLEDVFIKRTGHRFWNENP